MKILPWKKIVFVFLSLTVITAGVLYFKTARSKGDYTTAINPAFGEYISSYTAGVVNSNAVVRLVLVDDAVDSTSLGETSVKLFDLSPSVKGTTIWLDSRTIEFRPSTRLLSGQVYRSRVCPCYRAGGAKKFKHIQIFLPSHSTEF